MRSLLFCALVALVTGTKILQEDFTTLIDRASIVKTVNEMKTTWVAEVSARFANATVADVKRQLGTILSTEEGYIAPELEKTVFKTDAIPEAFDVRTNWPECASVSGRVRDQSNCGSCWSFGSTEAFNDRYCIETGDANMVFSAEDTVSCCTGRECSFSMGCNGGQPAGAWNWFQSHGVTTGADYADVGKGTTCKPYSMQSCAHHVDPVPAGMVNCNTLKEYSTPKCTSTCNEKNYATAYKEDKHFASSSYSVKGVSNIQKELMEKGTISVAFTVYEDFESYKSGVYQHVTGKSLGGHAIKLVGWGVDKGTPYWTCVNSWNDSWGEKGTFRILRGKNECGIEGDCVAGTIKK